jgi:hypothetical protein
VGLVLSIPAGLVFVKFPGANSLAWLWFGIWSASVIGFALILYFVGRQAWCDAMNMGNFVAQSRLLDRLEQKSKRASRDDEDDLAQFKAAD